MNSMDILILPLFHSSLYPNKKAADSAGQEIHDASMFVSLSFGFKKMQGYSGTSIYPETPLMCVTCSHQGASPLF